MKITLSQYAGFCDGVERAYKIVSEIAKDKSLPRPVCTLGSLVHNDDVVKKIEAMGIKKIKAHSAKKLKEAIKKQGLRVGTLVITAHGAGPELYEFLKREKIHLVDATCPKVIRVQRLAQSFSRRSYQVVIVGDPHHREIKGISEWAGNGTVAVESEKDVQNLKLNPKKNIVVLSQTTQNQDIFKSLAEKIAKKYPKVEVIKTLCHTTQNRQDEVKKMAKKNEVIIVIGSRKSANSTHLWKIAKGINPRSYFIERVKEIEPRWLSRCKTVGITAGASTPQWIIEEVLKSLHKK